MLSNVFQFSGKPYMVKAIPEKAVRDDSQIDTTQKENTLTSKKLMTTEAHTKPTTIPVVKTTTPPTTTTTTTMTTKTTTTTTTTEIPVTTTEAEISKKTTLTSAGTSFLHSTSPTLILFIYTYLQKYQMVLSFLLI